MKKHRSSWSSSLELNCYAYVLPSLIVLQFFGHSSLYQYVRDLSHTDDQQAGVAILCAWSFFFFVVSLMGRLYVTKFNINELLTIYSLLTYLNAFFIVLYGIGILAASPSPYHY
jgi:uncharacterized membrane protein YiaA